MSKAGRARSQRTARHRDSARPQTAERRVPLLAAQEIEERADRVGACARADSEGARAVSGGCRGSVPGAEPARLKGTTAASPASSRSGVTGSRRRATRSAPDALAEPGCATPRARPLRPWIRTRVVPCPRAWALQTPALSAPAPASTQGICATSRSRSGCVAPPSMMRLSSWSAATTTSAPSVEARRRKSAAVSTATPVPARALVRRGGRGHAWRHRGACLHAQRRLGGARRRGEERRTDAQASSSHHLRRARATTGGRCGKAAVAGAAAHRFAGGIGLEAQLHLAEGPSGGATTAPRATDSRSRS